MKNHIVIARYNENIDWIKHINLDMYRVYVYNKGGKISTKTYSHDIMVIDLENVGREAHTYLHHIIAHYDSLPEKVIFTQGYPFDHVKSTFIDDIHRTIEDSFHYFSNNRLHLKFNDTATILDESGV